MIIKSFEIKKIHPENNNFVLLYGKNEGYKNEAIKNLIQNNNAILKYEEKEILDNDEKFIENLLSKSLFESEKTIIIRRATDKLLKIINELIIKNMDGIFVVIISENLDKKSKLRSFFEKHKKFVCVPFYPDNFQVLTKLTYEFLKKENVPISNENMNLIIKKCNNDRETLFNELQKIVLFAKNGKKITAENITKLTNLTENYAVSELVDNCLIKNKKKVINILNENNFNSEDCILITRSFLNKAKKILTLTNEYRKNKNIELTISSAKPPIFWKDKKITKQQIFNWTPKNIKQLIFKLCQIELLIKKNINNAINLITDFILNQASSDISNS